MKRLAFVVIFACGLAGCGGPDNDLKGSMSQVYPLKFDEVRILRVGEGLKTEVSIEYLKLSGGLPESYPAKLTVQIGDLTGLAGNKIDCLDKDHLPPNGLPRCTLARINADSTATDFTLKLGSVLFDQEPVVDTDLSGHFYTTVSSEETDRTLNGDFKAKVLGVAP
jgi:hypothetical protein